MQSLGKIIQRARAVGSKCGDCFFVCLFLSRVGSGEPCVRGCIVRTRIALPFIGRFRRGLQLFSEGIAL